MIKQGKPQTSDGNSFQAFKLLPAMALTLLAGMSLASCEQSEPAQALGTAPPVSPRAVCGPGSKPETGIQGRVSTEDYESGRAAEGFTCNTELVGSYTTPNATGTVGGFKVERYVDDDGHDCAYYDTTLLYPTNAFDAQSGVNVLDMSDPTNPVLSAQLVTPAMQSPHESLILSHQRGVLGATLGNAANYPGVLDLYDISADCRAPVFKSSTPFGVLGHESGIAPDGLTFYSASPGSPTLTAIDISDLTLPVPLTIAQVKSHGLTISEDGNRAYVGAGSGVSTSGGLRGDTGLIILDTTEVQARVPNPTMREISRVDWPTLSIPQNAIPITINGHPYVVEIDEFGSQRQVGAGRIIDIGDETKPVVISDLRLEVHQPENFALQANDPGASNPIQGYAGHYCNVPKRTDPGIVACSMILSGLRIFDIRDPFHPREVAYFNPPPKELSTPASQASYAMSSPSFVPERREIWYTDGNSGFYVVRVTNGMWQ